MAERLGAAVESLRVAYGHSTGMAPDQLKRVFSDALRWQLGRILEDQAGSVAPAEDHGTINAIYAEAWSFLERGGTKACWTMDEHDRLIRVGWSVERAKAVANLVFDLQLGEPVSKVQLDSYADAFNIVLTQDNVARLARVICSARAAACREASARLPSDEANENDAAQKIEEALTDDEPFTFQRIVEPATPDTQPARPVPRTNFETDLPPQSPIPKRKMKRLIDAGEECISAYLKEKAWDVESVKQVRTALRLFDYACGADVFIEDIEQRHIRAFTDLCKALPNRWGRTREEQAGGIAASLERAATMSPADIGISQVTINKHLTWVTAVLAHAASDENDDQGHTPSAPLTFKSARAGIGKASKKQRKRDRDKRANWSKQEIAKLLSAPIWTGAAGIDRRLTPGREIIHDAWYWLPLMLPLYGGRSSELAGLALAEVHERDPIPFFQIDYTEDRSLKNLQSVRKLPIHPELIRLGFIDYVIALRDAEATMLFPEMNSPGSASFASTFYKSIFVKLRSWAFPEGTQWRHRERGAWRDKDVHSFRGLATSMLKGHVPDSVRCDIFGHEGETETARTYDDEADLQVKLDALLPLTVLTDHIQAAPLRIRPVERLRHGVRGPKPRISLSSSRGTASDS